MKIAVVTVGEPLPILEGAHDRALRTGYLSVFLAERGHDVTWWTSAFDHSRRKMIVGVGERVSVQRGLEIRLLNGGGYKANVSLERIRDHRRLAREFAVAVRREPRPDIILSSFPPIELGLAAVEYGEEAHVPVVLDIRDLWPDIFVDEFPSWARPAARVLLTPFFRQAGRACRGATAITGITPALVNWGLQRGGRSRSERDRAFPMGYPTRPPSPNRLAEAEAFWTEMGVTAESRERTICFIGSLGRQFDLVPVIECAARLSRRGVPVRFVLCGVGERLERYRRMSAGLENVVLPGWIDEAKIYVLLRRAYAGVDPLPDRYDFLGTINNKAIEYLSAGVPVISSPPRGLLAESLAEHDCGASCEAGDPDALADVVEYACANPEAWARKSKNAKAFFDRELSAETVYESFHQHLKSIALSSGRDGADRQ